MREAHWACRPCPPHLRPLLPCPFWNNSHLLSHVTYPLECYFCVRHERLSGSVRPIIPGIVLCCTEPAGFHLYYPPSRIPKVVSYVHGLSHAHTNTRMTQTRRILKVNLSAFWGHFWGQSWGGKAGACGPLAAPPATIPITTPTHLHMYTESKCWDLRGRNGEMSRSLSWKTSRTSSRWSASSASMSL